MEAKLRQAIDTAVATQWGKNTRGTQVEPLTGDASSRSYARLYLTGGGSRVPGLAGVLSDRLRVPVTQAHAVERLTVAPGAFDGLNVDEVSPLLMLPVGLALRAASGGERPRRR